MKSQGLQNGITKLVITGLLVAGTLLVGTGCDLENPAAKKVVNAAARISWGPGDGGEPTFIGWGGDGGEPTFLPLDRFSR